MTPKHRRIHSNLYIPRHLSVAGVVLLSLNASILGVDALATSTTTPLSVGIDLGTSGARLSAIVPSSSPTPTEVFTCALAWTQYDDPDLWVDTVQQLLHKLAHNDNTKHMPVESVCVSGTSASCLIFDTATNKVTRKPRMYDDNVLSLQDDKVLQELLDRHVPARHTARSGTSSFAKLLSWHLESPLKSTERLLHQADYVAYCLAREGNNHKSEQPHVSDWHNCLKLGYDVRNLEWPLWMYDCFKEVSIPETVLPDIVLSPGAPLYKTDSDTFLLVAGTTDSNAAFVAGCYPLVTAGTAVTSLGSTVALKQLSDMYIEDADRGVYSHRFPSTLVEPGQQDLWLVGGASNVGCAVLRSLDFSNNELDELSQRIDPMRDSPLSYYPLTKTGERFPVSDSAKEPILEPVPSDRAEFLHGVLQGISDVERDGYVVLKELGASPRCQKIWTCGGGSKNDVWTRLRQRRLQTPFPGIEVSRAVNVEASYGAALLAQAGVRVSVPLDGDVLATL